jgi:hypothetical protein
MTRRTARDANRWIVSDHSFFEHDNPIDAIKECQRLQGNNPNKIYRIYRIKNVLAAPLPYQIKFKKRSPKLTWLGRLLGRLVLQP